MQRQSNFWPISHVGITLNVNRARDGHKLRRRYKLAVIRFSGCDPPHLGTPSHSGRIEPLPANSCARHWGMMPRSKNASWAATRRGPVLEILRDSRAEKRLREKPPSAVRFIDRSTSHSWCSSMPTGLRQQGRGTAKKTSSDKFAHARTACVPRREGTAALSRRFFKSTIVPQFARTAESCPARAPSRSLWSRVKYSESGSTVY